LKVSRNLIDAALVAIIIALAISNVYLYTELNVGREVYRLATTSAHAPDVFFTVGIHTGDFDLTTGNITIHYRVEFANDTRATAIVTYEGSNYLLIKTLHATSIGLEDNVMQFEQVGRTIGCFKQGDTLNLYIDAGIHDFGLIEIWYDFNSSCAVSS
jgi:hypothetical protein